MITNIIILGQTKESPDLSCPLGTQPVGEVLIGQAWEIIVTLLDNDEGQHSKIIANDTSPNRLPLPLTSTPWSVAGVALGQQKPDTSGVHNTLLHWETLLVVASGNFENISLELITNAVAWHFLPHALVLEDSETAVIVDFDKLLSAIGGVPIIVEARTSVIELYVG